MDLDGGRVLPEYHPAENSAFEEPVQASTIADGTDPRSCDPSCDTRHSPHKGHRADIVGEPIVLP